MKKYKAKWRLYYKAYYIYDKINNKYIWKCKDKEKAKKFANALNENCTMCKGSKCLNTACNKCIKCECIKEDL